MSGRFPRWAGALAVVGAVTLALPAYSVLAEPGPAPPHTGAPGTRSTDTGAAAGGASGTGPPETASRDTGEGGLGRVTEGVDGGGTETGTGGTTAGPETRTGTRPDADAAVDAERAAGADADPDADAEDRTGTGGGPAVRDPGALLGRLRTLYHASEASAAAYRESRADLRAARQRAEELTSRLAAARARLARGRADVGRLARQQYQGAGPGVLASYLRVLWARDPQRAMDRGQVLRQAARGQAAVVTRLTAQERRAGRLARRERAALAEQRRLTDRCKERRNAARAGLKAVERLLAGLSEEQLVLLVRPDTPAAGGRASTGRGPEEVSRPAAR
ncbi:coiled-coil domain-containing protein [Streptomyces celluloflavus]|uniref:coiled-coil domain-containing protein n=1 Tax=Streptomyces celluloflavus TaxID=58344 RepID=UPI0036DE1501